MRARCTLAFLGLLLSTTVGAVTPIELAYDVVEFTVSPDGRYVAYSRYLDDVERIEVVSIGGGPPVHVFGVSGGPALNRGAFRFGPDSSRLIVRAQAVIPGDWTLYSVPITGPPEHAVAISSPDGASTGVSVWTISGDGAYVVYQSDEGEGGGDRLFSSPITGPASARVRLDQLEGLQSSVAGLRLSDAGDEVYYAAFSGPGPSQVVRVPVTGPASAGQVLSDESKVGSGVVTHADEPFRQAGDRLLFIGWDREALRYDLFSAELDAKHPRTSRLSPRALPANRERILASPDGQWAVFTSPDEDDHPEDTLLSAPADGRSSAAEILAEQLDGGLYGDRLFVSPDSTRVLYQLDAGFNERYDLFSVPIEGPADATVQLSPVIPNDHRVLGVTFLPGGFVGFGIRTWTGPIVGYRAPVDGSSAAETLWDELPCYPSEPTRWFQARPDRDSALLTCFDYLPPGHGGFRVWLVRVAGARELPLLLANTTDFAPGGRIDQEIEWTVDGDWLVFRVRDFVVPDRLFALPIPRFWDGFESGTLARWTEAAP